MAVETLHPIQVAARRSGLSVETVRAWERRHRAVTPKRTRNRRRLYRDGDIERLRLLARAVRAGRRIGELAKLSTARLAAMVEEDEQAALLVPAADPARPRTESVMGYFDECLEAIDALDPAALAGTLQHAEKALDEPVTLEELIAPLMEHVRDECRLSTMRMAHERLFRNVLRGHMARSACPAEPATGGSPRIVVSGLCVQADDLPLLRLAVAARAYGWHPVYLGAGLAADEITFAVERAGARCTLLSAESTESELLPNELRKLRRAAPEGHPILLLGSSLGPFRTVIDDIGIVPVQEFAGLRLTLDRMRRSPPGP